jgi:uncharacterized protein YuzE
MKIEYDRDADALYIYIQQTEAEKSVEISEGINVDLDFNGNLIGIEIIGATQRYSLSDIFNLSTENLIFDQTVIAGQNGKVETSGRLC